MMASPPPPPENTSYGCTICWKFHLSFLKVIFNASFNWGEGAAKGGNQFSCTFHVGSVLITKVSAYIFTSRVFGTCLCKTSGRSSLLSFIAY